MQKIAEGGGDVAPTAIKGMTSSINGAELGKGIDLSVDLATAEVPPEEKLADKVQTMESASAIDTVAAVPEGLGFEGDADLSQQAEGGAGDTTSGFSEATGTTNGSKPPEATSDRGVAGTEKTADQTKSETTDNTARRQELEDKVKKGEATPEEMGELRDLKRPEKRQEDLQQKVMEGTATDDEIEELDRINRGEEKPAELTPEQQMEKLQEDIEDLGTDIMTKLANGEEVSQEELDKIRELRSQEQLMRQGFSEKNAREAVQAALKGEGKFSSEKHSRRMKDVQDELQELMSIEFQILSLPKSVASLREQREKAKDEARKRHNEAESATGQDRLKKKAVEYQAYMQVANINGQINGIRYMAHRLEARRSDLEQAVRRKLGVTGGLGALMKWGAAKTRVVVTEIGIAAAEELPIDA